LCFRYNLVPFQNTKEGDINMPEAKPVVVTKSSSLKESGGQTEGMIRQNALVNLTDGICASRMIAKPHSGSAVHHHGEQDTVVFAFSGYGTIVSEGGKKKQKLDPGDYALIPAYAEHQEVNEGDEEVVWCIVRSGKEPKVFNLDGWGTS
jgi:uncharacterized RmlC-like cupin family protein